MLSHQHARLVAKNQKLSSTPVNPPKPAITSAVLLPDGTPLILCGTMGAFRYDPGMRGWTRVADPGTLNAATTLIGPQASEVMAAARLREKIAQGVDKMANLAKGKKITAGFIENQLGAARALGSVAEYRYWLRLYAQRLVDEVATEKAQELIDELAGASMVVDTKAVGAGQPAIGTTFVSFNRRQRELMCFEASSLTTFARQDDTTRKILLQDVIPILAKQRAFQRIVTAVVA